MRRRLLPISTLCMVAALGIAGCANKTSKPVDSFWSWNAPVRSKSGHARQPCHRMVTHDRRNHRRSASCFAGLALSPAWTVDIKQALRMGAAGYGVAAFLFFVVQATPRKTEKGTEDLHAAVGNSAFRRRHNYLV